MSKTPEEKARHAAYMREYYHANKEACLARVTEYRTANKRLIAKKKKDYYDSPAGEAQRKAAHARNYPKNRCRLIEYQKNLRAMQPEKMREADKRKYEKNKEKIIARCAQYAKENPDVRKRASAKYMAANKDKYNAFGARYRAAKLQAIPKWADLDAIEEVYQEAKYHGLHVDHIVPLQSKLVCGLHVWDNLQLLAESANKAKGNRHWPNMP